MNRRNVHGRFLIPALLGLLACSAESDELISERPSATTSDSGAADASTKPPSSRVDAGRDQPDARSPTPPNMNKDASGPDVCDTITKAPQRVIPEVLIVLDRSGSMRPNGNDQQTDRWTGSVNAIVEVTATLDKTIHFGLMTFPAFVPDMGGGDDDDECTAGTVNVPIGAMKGGDIATALRGMDADGRTPTAASLEAARTALGPAPVGDVASASRYVLLVTDGDPNCSGMQRNGADTAARQQTIAAINALRMAGVKTYVVGFQTAGTEFSQQLDMMAAAGGTGETMHRSVDSSAALTTALSQLAGEVASCTYELNEAVDDPRYIRVTVGARDRMMDDAADGWKLSANRKGIELVGTACNDVRKGAGVSVVVECGVVGVF